MFLIRRAGFVSFSIGSATPATSILQHLPGPSSSTSHIPPSEPAKFTKEQSEGLDFLLRHVRIRKPDGRHMKVYELLGLKDPNHPPEHVTSAHVGVDKVLRRFSRMKRAIKKGKEDQAAKRAGAPKRKPKEKEYVVIRREAGGIVKDNSFLDSVSRRVTRSQV